MGWDNVSRSFAYRLAVFASLGTWISTQSIQDIGQVITVLLAQSEGMVRQLQAHLPEVVAALGPVFERFGAMFR